jgi:xanthine dehydrogenase iron-sulfur cluster and FAD-binding subunit A
MGDAFISKFTGYKQLCQVCAETCEAFAVEIAKFETENAMISDTVKSCITFAQACRKVGKE